MPKFNGLPVTDGNIKGGLEVLHIRIITWLPQTNPSVVWLRQFEPRQP
jgi:hypothetical protein